MSPKAILIGFFGMLLLRHLGGDKNLKFVNQRGSALRATPLLTAGGIERVQR